MRKKKNVSYIRFFNNFVSTNILKEQKNKSDHIWRQNKIFIRYTNKIIKHFKIYVPQTGQFIIISKPIIQEIK